MHAIYGLRVWRKRIYYWCGCLTAIPLGADQRQHATYF